MERNKDACKRIFERYNDACKKMIFDSYKGACTVSLVFKSSFLSHGFERVSIMIEQQVCNKDSMMTHFSEMIKANCDDDVPIS